MENNKRTDLKFEASAFAIKMIMKNFQSGLEMSDLEYYVNHYVQKGIDINNIEMTPFCGGGSLLHSICNSPFTRPYIVRALVDAGAKVDLKDRYFGRTPLHLAAQIGAILTIKELAKAGADVNVRDKNSDTPLMYIAENGNIDDIDTLIRLGADISLENNSRETALDIYRRAQYKNIQWLEKTWADSVLKQKDIDRSKLPRPGMKDKNK